VRYPTWSRRDLIRVHNVMAWIGRIGLVAMLVTFVGGILWWGDWRWWIMFAVATTVVIAAGWFIVDIAVEYHDRTQRLRKRLDRR